MFRISQYLREVVQAEQQGSYPLARHGHTPPGPVVIWNLIRRCNLSCLHCYSISTDKEFAGELSREEVSTVMKDLKAYGVPVLILSGGEPAALTLLDAVVRIDVGEIEFNDGAKRITGSPFSST